MDRRSPDVSAVLEAFVSARPGLRLGRCFGEAAVFAGRRVAIRVAGREVAMRLSPAGRDLARGLGRGSAGRWHNGWLYLPADRPASLLARLFEHAVHHVATA